MGRRHQKSIASKQISATSASVKTVDSSSERSTRGRGARRSIEHPSPQEESAAEVMASKSRLMPFPFIGALWWSIGIIGILIFCAHRFPEFDIIGFLNAFGTAFRGSGTGELVAYLEAIRAAMGVYGSEAFGWIMHMLSVVREMELESLKTAVEEWRQRYGNWKVEWSCLGLLIVLPFGLAVVRCRRRVGKTTKQSYKSGAKYGDVQFTDDVEVLLSDESNEEGAEGYGVSDREDDAGGKGAEGRRAFIDDEGVYYGGRSGDERTNVTFIKNKLSAAEYSKQTEDTTRSEVLKLLQSPEFRYLVKQRGKDDSAYNWQKRATKSNPPH